MKLVENVIYSSIVFVFSYIIISMTLRLFNITDSVTSHMIGGIIGTLLGVSLFIYLLIYKPKKK